VICFDPFRRRSKHITALRSSDLRSANCWSICWLLSCTHVHLPPILCYTSVALIAFFAFSCQLWQSFHYTQTHFVHAPTPFKSWSSLLLLCLDTWWHYGLLAILPITLSAQAHVVIVNTGTFDAHTTGARALVQLYTLPSPTMSYNLSSAPHEISTPMTPISLTMTTTTTLCSVHHLCPHPHYPSLHVHFCTFPASITAHLPFSLSFPLSLLLLLSGRCMSSPGAGPQNAVSLGLRS